MADYTIVIHGLTELVERCETAGANAKPLVNAAIVKSAYVVQGNIRSEAPHRTGALQRSILVTSSEGSAVVSAHEPYAVYIEGGTAPHDIYPKSKKALFWPGAAHPVRRVHNPGVKANPFFTRGVDDSHNELQDIFTGVGERIVTELAGK